MATIKLEDLVKTYGDVEVLHNLNGNIKDGEFVVVVGPSGCGKSTLLRMIAGLEKITSGKISIEDKIVNDLEPAERDIAMVFQNYAIFPHLDVRDNIAFGMRKAGLTRAELDKRIDEVLELIKLPGYGKRGADELSGGQRQRVALARALIKQPKVLLLDEPLGALDKKLREQMQIELRQLQQQIGITFLFVTHDQEEALTLSDQIAVMSEGEVMEIASPGQLYESPGSRFVADFIGSMNFFEGEISSSTDSAVTVQTPVLGEVKVTGSDAGVSTGQQVWVAIRPEKMQPVFSDPGESTNTAGGTMGLSAYLGDRSHFYVHLPQREDPVLVALQNLERSMTYLHKPSQPVWLQWASDAVVVLPRD